MCGILLAAATGHCFWISSATSSTDSFDQATIFQFLNNVIDWYQNEALDFQTAVSPADVAFANENAPAADQVVRLSFDSARAVARLLGTSPKPASTDARYQSLMQRAASLEAESNQAQTEVESLQQKLSAAPRKQRQGIQSQIARLDSETAMRQAQLDTVNGMLDFFAAGTPGAGGLLSNIEALERSLPASTNPPSKAAAVLNQGPTNSPLAIWASLRQSFRFSTEMRAIANKSQRTDDLIAKVKQLQAPLRSQLSALSRQADSIVSQPISEDPAVAAQQKAQLDSLTARFKRTAAAAVPLGKEAIVLDVYKRNLGNWYQAIKGEYSASLKSLATKSVVLAGIIAVVLGVFALWRKAILRYVKDYRRRYQFMLLRRIVLWSVIAIVIVLGFVNQFGGLATYAGLMTAGVAVALQTVILAIAGYFMLMGKFGVSVGDRVQIADITGRVVDIGLIRFHLMELTGTGADAQPTGRMIAFANSIAFQTTAGLFRQVPGTSFVWRETNFTLAADSDYRDVEQRLLTAVDAAFHGYKADLERLGRQMEKSLTSIAVGPLAPKLHFRLTPAGLEVSLRFPVEMRMAEEMDDRVTRELLRAIDMEPKLKIVAADVPAMQLRANVANTTSAA